MPGLYPAPDGLKASRQRRHGSNMRKAWQVREAKARFGAFLEASLRYGPQIVTRRGVETAVLLPIEQWRRLRETAVSGPPGLKTLLLAPDARTETLVPPRARHRSRPASPLA